MLSFQRNDCIFKWQFSDRQVIMNRSISSSSNCTTIKNELMSLIFRKDYLSADENNILLLYPHKLVQKIPSKSPSPKGLKSLFAESVDYSKMSKTQSIARNCRWPEIFVLITKKLNFRHLRTSPLFFAESEHRINTCLQPFLQIFNKFFIIFRRIRIFTNKIFFYFIKLMNFQFCRIIFLDGFSICCQLYSALILHQWPIRERQFKTPPDRVIYIPELTARSINSRNKFLVMKPSSKASSAVK